MTTVQKKKTTHKPTRVLAATGAHRVVRTMGVWLLASAALTLQVSSYAAATTTSATQQQGEQASKSFKNCRHFFAENKPPLVVPAAIVAPPPHQSTSRSVKELVRAALPS